MLDHMFRRRALVYYDNSAGTIHVSGHASQEEQKLLLQLVKPKYFIPVHGEYRHLLRDEIRSEEHTSELQSLTNLVCRLLLEKKKKKQQKNKTNNKTT